MKGASQARSLQTWRQLALLLLLSCTLAVARAAEPAPPSSATARTTRPLPGVGRSFLDVPYARVGTKTLALDLHLPAGVARPPLVIYLHGGAWRLGDKSEVPPFLIERGFAVASLNFRSSEEARFPANVHDIKAGIRFLRAKAGEYGYRADRIAISGSSSGGHLAALIGVTNGNAALDGSEGTHGEESSTVQAFITWVGASNLQTIIPQSTPEGLKMRVPALLLLLGALPEEVPELAQLASPVEHVDASDPPALILHGDQDQTMPVNQALELDAAYRRAGLVADMLIVPGVGHVAEPFFGAGEAQERAIAFLHRTIGR
jgi:acetyl esterase/lipase